MDETRRVLPDVARINWNQFASSVVSAMRHLGETVSEASVTATSGIAFRMSLPANVWEPGNYATLSFAATEGEPVSRAFAALGRECSYYPPGVREDDLARIAQSIRRGVPVLGFGVVSCSDCDLITGYDDGGDVLLGWSCHQDIPEDHDYAPDPTGYFRKPEWHAGLCGYAVMGGRTEAPGPGATCRATLAWAEQLIRAPRIRQRTNGLAAYEAWASALTCEGAFTSAGDDLGGLYLGLCCNSMMTGDRRAAADYLTEVAESVSCLAPYLAPLIADYRGLQRLGEALNACIAGDFSPEAVAAFASASCRREYARTLLSMRDAEAKAADHINEFLAATGWLAGAPGAI